MNNFNIYKFPIEILEEQGDREFCKFKIRDWYSSSPPLTNEDLNKELKILLVRPSSRGDVLLLTPILKAIKIKYKDAIIDVMTIHAELFKFNPYCNGVLSVSRNIDFKKYNRIYFMSYEFTPNLHIVDAYSRIVGVEVKNYEPEIFLLESEIEIAKKKLDVLTSKRNVIAFHKECGWASRRWKDQSWEIIVSELRDKYKDCDFISFCVNPNAVIKNTIGVINEDLRIVAAMIKQCKMLICVDSGIMHLGIAVNRPVVSLFSITNPQYRLPDRWLKFAVQHNGLTAGIHHRSQIPTFVEPNGIVLNQCCIEMYSMKPDMVQEKIELAFKACELKKVSIVIPSFNKYHFTKECIQSILDKSNSWNYEIIIADDNSDFETKQNLMIWNRICNVQSYSENVGFTKNCNRGAKEAKGEYIVLLNNDTTLISKDWINELIKTFENNEIGIIGAKLLYLDDTIQHAGIIWDGNGFHIYKHLPRSFINANKFKFYKSVTGAFLAIRNLIWKQLNGFDESYINSAEDSDLCFRCTNVLGLKIAYNPNIEFYHYEGATLGITKSFDRDNSKLLFSKWSGLISKLDDSEDLKTLPPYKLEIGSGMNPQPGYIHLDIMKDAKNVDIVHDLNKSLPIGDSCVKEILANHVVEHVSWRQFPVILRDWYRVLVKDGVLFIRTPNLEFIMNMYNLKKTTPEHKDDEEFIIKNFGSVTHSMYAILKLFSGQDYPSNFHFACYDPITLRDLCLREKFYRVKIERFGPEFSPGEIQLIAIK
jgi:GT2 family glycosyltransferase/ADP-heptose:LPS heptosyltransferase/predicted SAM-dependent methyltransferase